MKYLNKIVTFTSDEAPGLAHCTAPSQMVRLSCNRIKMYLEITIDVKK